MVGPILGLDGPVVVVTPPVAARLARELVPLLQQAQRRGQSVDPDTAATIRAFAQIGNAYRATARAETIGSYGSNGSATDGSAVTVVTMTTNQVADLLGTGERNVRDLVQRGRLIASGRVGRGWRFDVLDVARFLEERAQ